GPLDVGQTKARGVRQRGVKVGSKWGCFGDSAMGMPHVADRVTSRPGRQLGPSRSGKPWAMFFIVGSTLSRHGNPRAGHQLAVSGATLLALWSAANPVSSTGA